MFFWRQTDSSAWLFVSNTCYNDEITHRSMLSSAVQHWFSEKQICAFPHSYMTDWHLQTLISDCFKKQHLHKNLGHHPITDECRNKQWNAIWLKTAVGDVLQANAFQLPKWQENSRSHNAFICFSLNTESLCGFYLWHQQRGTISQLPTVTNLTVRNTICLHMNNGKTCNYIT